MRYRFIQVDFFIIRDLQHTTWKAYSHPHGDETILVICSNTFNSRL